MNLNQLRQAASEGDMDKVQEMLSYTAEGGHIYNYNWAMYHAAEGGHMNIVQLMLSLGADNYNQAMFEATMKGHMDIVQLMLEYGANNYDNAMVAAAECGYIDIVQLMLSLGTDNYNEALQNAAWGGHINIVQLMLELGADNYNKAMWNAELRGHMDIVNLIKAYRDNDEEMKRYYRAVAARYSLRKKHEKMVQKHIARFELEKRLPPEIVTQHVLGYLFGSRRRSRKRT